MCIIFRISFSFPLPSRVPLISRSFEWICHFLPVSLSFASSFGDIAPMDRALPLPLLPQPINLADTVCACPLCLSLPKLPNWKLVWPIQWPPLAECHSICPPSQWPSALPHTPPPPSLVENGSLQHQLFHPNGPSYGQERIDQQWIGLVWVDGVGERKIMIWIFFGLKYKNM